MKNRLIAVDSIKRLSAQADTLADAAIVDYQAAAPAVRASLKQGLLQGAAAVRELPESFRALLEDSEAALSSMPTTDINAALEPYLWIGPIWLSISLGPGSLAHTYADPGIASILMRTGKLVGPAVSRRLLETQAWKVSVLKPGGLAIGGSGYVNTLQVRLLHAQVRAKLMRNGWRDPDGKVSVPIDQLQMLRTWLDFTVVPFNALERAGFSLTLDQTSALYAAWRLVGRLLGVESAVLDLVTGHDKATELLALVDRDLHAPDHHSRVLVHAMLEALGNRLAPVLGMPVDIAFLLMASWCRLFHGYELADSLGVEKNWTWALLPTMADANRYKLLRLDDDPQYKATERQKNIEAFATIESGLEGLAAFQALPLASL